MMTETKTKIEVQLTGTDGNVFALLGKVGKALRRGGFPELEKELTSRVFAASSYDEALQLMMEYVEVT